MKYIRVMMDMPMREGVSSEDGRKAAELIAKSFPDGELTEEETKFVDSVINTDASEEDILISSEVVGIG